jgi:hypothetical protein
MSACACSTDTPGLRRPKTRNEFDPRFDARAPNAMLVTAAVPDDPGTKLLEITRWREGAAHVVWLA